MSNYYCKYCQEAVIDNWHDSTHTCKKGAYILPTPDWNFECLCWEVMDTYYCRCPRCKEENMIDVHWRLIKIL